MPLALQQLLSRDEDSAYGTSMTAAGSVGTNAEKYVPEHDFGVDDVREVRKFL